jgi:hypothetical protein
MNVSVNHNRFYLSPQLMQHVSAIFKNKMRFILCFKYYVFNAIAVTMKNVVFGAVTQCSFVDKSKV